ncbi:gb [Venturia nashicola]|uniref:Gb n=1 Tax=Venturia nashicola TaxID=86259 RepID=A0A4Z1NR63_9PEZI|nr:gb [Venturia nashicola]TLD26058.1 gb [Venturia nashicola]
MALSRRAAFQTSRALLRTSQRRSASHHAHDHHAEPVNESIGTGFYLFLGSITTAFVVYSLATPSKAGEESWITRKIRSYDQRLEVDKARNELHTKMVEQAGNDRLLLISSRNPNTPRTVDLRFQEQFNTGSPYNVPAGQGSINLEQVIDFYKKKNEDQEADRVKWAEFRQNNGTVQPSKEE